MPQRFDLILRSAPGARLEGRIPADAIESQKPESVVKYAHTLAHRGARVRLFEPTNHPGGGHKRNTPAMIDSSAR